MKEKNWILSIVSWIFIVAIGLFRTNIIHHNELVTGKPTMTGTFTFLAYLIVATIVFLISNPYKMLPIYHSSNLLTMKHYLPLK